MYKKFIFLIFLTPIFTYAGSCEIPKSKINISGLKLGKPISLVKREHPNSFIYDTEDGRASISYIGQGDFQDYFTGTPATNSGFITFDKKTKLVTGFSVAFDHLNNFNASNYKNGLIALYSLPTKNWNESQSNGYKVFNYRCDEYTLEINYNQERNSFMIVKEN